MSAAAPLGGGVDAWLDWQLSLHVSEMDLGLERVAAVAKKLKLLPLTARSVIVAGTNGKGSCAVMIDALLQRRGRVGTYTSPHLWLYNERIQIDGVPVTDVDLCSAFAAVEAVRGDTTLTYFEYGTLAALWLFSRYQVDFAVLEVGLGGRLDAVNIVDADVALITNIGLDHVDWLGHDRDSIGFEKAGVMRAGRPVVCADRDMPRVIATEAQRLGAHLSRLGRDFDIEVCESGWRWRGVVDTIDITVSDTVLEDNLAAVLAVYRALIGDLPDAEDTARAGAAQAKLAGRRERVDDVVPIIYDVGHNAEAIAVLVDDLAAHPVAGRTLMVIGMLADKPVETVAAKLAAQGDAYYLAGLDSLSARGLSSAQLRARLGVDGQCFDHPRPALAAALAAALPPGDRVVVCGSFLTVANSRKQQEPRG